MEWFKILPFSTTYLFLLNSRAGRREGACAPYRADHNAVYFSLTPFHLGFTLRGLTQADEVWAHAPFCQLCGNSNNPRLQDVVSGSIFSVQNGNRALNCVQPCYASVSSPKEI